MSIFDKARETADKAKEKAEELVEKVKSRRDHDESAPASSDAETRTIPRDGAVTPADVAESVSDPDLPHPEPPTDEPSGGGRPT
jgi:hypothetical protein